MFNQYQYQLGHSYDKIIVSLILRHLEKNTNVWRICWTLFCLKEKGQNRLALTFGAKSFGHSPINPRSKTYIYLIQHMAESTIQHVQQGTKVYTSRATNFITAAMSSQHVC